MANEKLILAPYGYKAGKLYSQIPTDGSGDFTVSRSGTATQFNSNLELEDVAANVPRFDFLNGCGSLLVEPTATNRFRHSSDFTQANWNQANINVTPDAAASPKAGNMADLIYPASNQTIKFNCGLTEFISGLSNIQRCHSFFVKSAGWRWIYFVDTTGSRALWFDTIDGVVGTQEAGTKLTVKAVTNGWWYCTITDCAALNQIYGGIYFANANGSSTVTTSGTSGVYLYQGQGEDGNSPTSTIFTGAAAVTRNADVITVTPPTGTSQIITTFSDDTTQIVTSIPGTFTAPNGRIKSIVML